jgi:hypothetical protein
LADLHHKHKLVGHSRSCRLQDRSRDKEQYRCLTKVLFRYLISHLCHVRRCLTEPFRKEWCAIQMAALAHRVVVLAVHELAE